MDLRFHWMLPKAGEVGIPTAAAAARYRMTSTEVDSPARLPDLPGWIRFIHAAEEAGIDSLLISFSYYEPEPLQIAGALGQLTDRIGFIAAFRSGLMQPAMFVQQVNSLSTLIGGRISLNIVAGSSQREQHGYGDFLNHDDRYDRTDEYLQVCHAFWKNPVEANFDGRHYRIVGGRLHTPFTAARRQSPEVFVSGHSAGAERLAVRQGSCWLRVIDTPDALRTVVARAREQGIEVGLRCGLICRETRAEAVRVAESVFVECTAARRDRIRAAKDDSQMYKEASALSDEARWIGRTIWTGFVPSCGPVWTTLLGAPDEIAAALIEYKQIGVSQFIISGLPEVDEVMHFGRSVLPLVRQAERELERSHLPSTKAECKS